MESVFIIAAIAGLISMVPGGLGAFDVVFLLGMTQQFDVSKSSVLLALVFYRLAYYILPFFLGLVLSISELQLILRKTKSFCLLKNLEQSLLILLKNEFKL
jgi:phosphatidylglycerol lysyltransferase